MERYLSPGIKSTIGLVLVTVGILGAIWMWDAHREFDEWSFGLQLAATGLGLIAAFSLDRWIERARDHKMEASRNKRLGQLVAALTSNVTYNMSSMERLARAMKKGVPWN